MKLQIICAFFWYFFFLVSLEGHPKMVTWSFLGPSKWRNSKRENDHVTIFCFFRGAHVNAVIAVRNRGNGNFSWGNSLKRRFPPGIIPIWRKTNKKGDFFLDSPREKIEFPRIGWGEMQFPSGEIQFLQARNSDVAGRNSGTSRIPPRKSNFPLGEIPANFEFVRRREKGQDAAKRKNEKIRKQITGQSFVNLCFFSASLSFNVLVVFTGKLWSAFKDFIFVALCLHCF